jgi:hypothetical protein
MPKQLYQYENRKKFSMPNRCTFIKHDFKGWIPSSISGESFLTDDDSSWKIVWDSFIPHPSVSRSPTHSIEFLESNFSPRVYNDLSSQYYLNHKIDYRDTEPAHGLVVRTKLTVMAALNSGLIISSLEVGLQLGAHPSQRLSLWIWLNENPWQQITISESWCAFTYLNGNLRAKFEKFRDCAER